MKKIRIFDNNGFSLIELIVTVLITSVLMIGVIAFLSTSRSAYQNVATSSTIQEETITVKRIINEYLSEAKVYGFQSGLTDITGSSGSVSVLWVVARDTEANSNPDQSNFFVLDAGDNKLRYCKGDASLCPESQTVLTDDAKTLIATECFASDPKKKYSIIGEHVESMTKAGVAQRYDGTDLVTIKLVYRYPEGSGMAYNDEITVVTRNRLRATPTPTPKPTATPLPTSATPTGGGSTPTPSPSPEPTSGGGSTPTPTPSPSPSPSPSPDPTSGPATVIVDSLSVSLSHSNSQYYSDGTIKYNDKKIKEAIVSTDASTLAVNDGNYEISDLGGGKWKISLKSGNGINQAQSSFGVACNNGGNSWMNNLTLNYVEYYE